MKYQIRPLQEEDISYIIAGEEEIFGSSLGFDMLYSELKLNPYAHYLVLEIDEIFGGYIGLWITEDTAEIVNFFIMKVYQGYGFGKMLLEFALDLCDLSNVKTISLEVRVDNERAINLYKKHGFKYSHIRYHYYDDGTDARVLIKKLRE